LELAGYPGLSRNFFQFIADRLEPEGCLLPKYNPDGTLASSWHPWSHEGRPQLPIQEDSTALVIWALWHHFVLFRDIEFLKPLYAHLVKKAADFMCEYRDKETGLPALS
jgi:glucoamylase